MNGVEEVKEEGEFDDQEIQPTKVHVRGLDNLSHFDLDAWIKDYTSMDLFSKIEWIDDNSANLVYDTEIAAIDALNALSAEEDVEPLRLRLAKPLTSRPEQNLEVRQAIVGDVKVKGAKDRSAFYLRNRDWDPDNPRNIRPDNRKRRWEDNGGRERNKYRRREWEDEREHRRGSRDQGEFTEDMYDEGGAAASVPPEDKRRPSSGSEYSRRRSTYDNDLFAPKQSERLRDRSASPGREGDGRYGFTEEQPRRRTARPRSATPPAIRQSRDNRAALQKARKELFPDRPTSSAFSNGHTNNRPSTPTRELFPDKLGTPNHRRQDGRDLPLEDVVHVMGQYQIDGAADDDVVHRTYSVHAGAQPSNSSRGDRKNGGGKGGDLFDRVKGGPKKESGRLSHDDADQ